MKKVIILASIILSGCSADGKFGKEGSPAWHNRATTAEKVQYVTPTCIEYGFKKGSAEFRQCVVEGYAAISPYFKRFGSSSKVWQGTVTPPLWFDPARVHHCPLRPDWSQVRVLLARLLQLLFYAM